LGFVKETRIGDIDEALLEGNPSRDENVDEHPVRASQSLLNEVKRRKEEKQKFMKGPNAAGSDINPESFLAVKSKHLITALPKSQEFDDIDDDDLNQLASANKMSLAEAFEDDDIINDFAEDVEMEAKKVAGVEISSLMPGWGSWSGQGVKNRKPRLQKQPFVKKKDKIIINNAPNEKLQKHLVSVVPFPFTTVKDFEASLKIPIGRDFIPESATRKLTMPAVLTRAGTIIEPMSEEVLVENGTNRNKFIRKGGKKIKRMKKK
jgi:U3 small nucleolar RNA-associated protein 14